MLTLSSFSGPFGVLAASGEPVGEGEPRPIFQAVQGLCELAGFRQVAARTSDETRLLTLAGRSAAGQTVMWLANLTASEVTVDIFGFERRRLVMTPYAITRIG
jgi:D-apionolactonase